jgi:hypothetical protein
MASDYFELLAMVGVSLVGWLIGWLIAQGGMK